MDTSRLIHLLEVGDLSAWPDLTRDLERRNDTPHTILVLNLLHAQQHTFEAAQWLTRLTDTHELQGLRNDILTRSHDWPAGRLKALVQDLLGGTFRLIPAGSFVMGAPEDEVGRFSKETQHPVEITRSFLLKTSPVTQAEWLALMGNNPSYAQGDERRPVEQVSWDDALAYCNTLSGNAGLSMCYDLSACTGTPGEEHYRGPDHADFDLSCTGYRLPTEAEWEYAYRAGSTSAFYNGPITKASGLDPNLDQIGWFNKNAGTGPQAVKGKQPNAWGLYDIAGNVLEWCWDWHKDYTRKPQRDPKGGDRVSYRIRRGGSWDFNARRARAAFRYCGSPSNRSATGGFRPARTI